MRGSVRDSAFEHIVCPVSRENPRNSEGDVIELRDGRLMLAYTEFHRGSISDHAPARVAARISSDGGRTWGEKFALVENEAKMNVMSVSLIRLQSGGIGLAYLRKNSLSDCRAYFRKSKDEGKTWTEPVCCTPLIAYNIVNNARVVQLRTGRILVPAAHTPDIGKEGFHLLSCCYHSDDSGLTWSRGDDVDTAGLGADEPGVVELKDGSVMMFIRTNLGRVYRSISRDGGVTFSNAEPMSLTAPWSPTSIKRISSTGDLLAVWNNSSGSRVPLTAAISPDEGRTWRCVRDLETKRVHRESARWDGYAYASMTFVGNRVILTYYVAGVPVEGVEGNNTWALKLKSLPVSWFYEQP